MRLFLKSVFLFATILTFLQVTETRAAYPANANAEEKKVLDRLDKEIDGAVVYTRNNDVRLVRIGDWTPRSLGPGEYARWSDDGRQVLVSLKGALYLVDVQSGNRRRLVESGVYSKGGCPMDFYPDGSAAVYVRDNKGLFTVDLKSGAIRDLEVPFDMEPGLNADASRLVGRRGGSIYTCDMSTKKQRRYGGGCSPGVSPSGEWIFHNNGDHTTMNVMRWDGSDGFKIDNHTLGPDKKWDNQHWSNHENYATIQGEHGPVEAYVFNVFENRGTRVSFEGNVRYPDLYVASGPSPAARASQSNPSFEDWSGAHTRVAWVQDQGDGRDTFAGGKDLRLMGWDSRDGRGTRPLLDKISNYTHPRITPKGDRVVYTDQSKWEVWIVDFEGGEPRKLVDGFGQNVWLDRSDGGEWLYYIPRNGRGAFSSGSEVWKSTGEDIWRMPIDGDAPPEKVWSNNDVQAGTFMVSADGKIAGGQFPWPQGGIVDLQSGKWKKLANGCWPALAPDNSYLYWIFDGQHRNVYMHDWQNGEQWKLNINSAPGIDGYEVYHPRWSNHVRFLTMTGPFKEGGGDNRIRGGGKAVEVYIGKMTPDLTQVESWQRITRNDKGDFYPDVWIEGGEKTVARHYGPNRRDPGKVEKETVAISEGEWPGSHDGLVYLWRSANETNQIMESGGKPGRSCALELKGAARYNRFYGIDLGSGAAHALNVDKELLERCKKSNALTIEAVVTPGNIMQSGPARIVSFSSNTSSRNFTLGQDGEKFVLRLRTPQTGGNGTNPAVEFGKIEPGRTYRVSAAYVPGLWTIFMNGEKVLESRSVTGDFSNWEPQHLIFGDEWTRDRDWTGSLEGVALYDRALPDQEIQHNHAVYARYLKGRKALPELTVRAKLSEVTPVPDLAALSAYNRALVVHNYEVLEVKKGKLGAKSILVAHWAIMDRKVLQSAGERHPGEACTLRLEPFEDHPQLQSERRFNDCQDFAAPLFYDIAPPKP